MITDRPLLVSVLYNRMKHGSATFERLAKELFHQYNNVNYFVHRNKPYNPNGRNETQNEAEQLGQQMMQLLIDEDIPFTHTDGNTEDYQWILDEIFLLLKADA